MSGFYTVSSYSMVQKTLSMLQGACQQGASNFALWESVRASSAAAYYLDDFTRGDDRCNQRTSRASPVALVPLRASSHAEAAEAAEAASLLGAQYAPMSNAVAEAASSLITFSGVHHTQRAMHHTSCLVSAQVPGRRCDGQQPGGPGAGGGARPVARHPGGRAGQPGQR